MDNLANLVGGASRDQLAARLSILSRNEALGKGLSFLIDDLEADGLKELQSGQVASLVEDVDESSGVQSAKGDSSLSNFGNDGANRASITIGGSGSVSAIGRGARSGSSS